MPDFLGSTPASRARRARRGPGLALVALTGLLCACRAGAIEDSRSWPQDRRGTVGLFLETGVHADYEAASRIEIQNANFGDAVSETTGDLEGVFGFRFGSEVALGGGLSALVGVDFRRFDPEPIPGFLFDEIDYTELFVGARWLAPWSLDGSGRLRPFVSAKLGWAPSIEFDAELDLSSTGATIPNPEFRFDGSSFLNAGLQLGFAYQWSPALVLHASAMYEWPLNASQDDVLVDLGLGGAVPPIELDTEIEPGGLIGWIGIGWYH